MGVRIEREGTIRAAAVLTNSYVAGTVISILDCTQATLLVRYKMGATESGNSLQIKIEFSNDNSAYYQECTEEAAAGIITISLAEYTFPAVAAAETYDNIRIPIQVMDRFVRVSAKETGVAVNYGTCEIKYAVGNR
jgi:hypothetical protein